MSSKSKLNLDSPSKSPSKSISPAKGKKVAPKEPKEKKGAKEEAKVAPAKGKGAKKENERPRSKSAKKDASPDKKKAARSKSQKSDTKSPAKGKGKAKQPQESVSPRKKSQSPLNKLTKDVEAMKAKKGGAKEEAKTKKEETKKTSKSGANEGHNYKTQPKKPTGSYLLFNTATTKRLKEEEGLDHPAAFKKAAELWAVISPKEKAIYEAEAAKDVARFEKETKDLKDKGYFVTSDGIKSTDLPVDPKKKWGKDVVCPKPVKSAYIFFSKENSSRIREEK